MKTQQAIDHYGSISALARAILVTPPAVHQWGAYPPDSKQLLIQRITRGKLKAEEGCYERAIGLDKPKTKA